MEAGALGVEIVISGKLRTERARFEKFRAGEFPRVGDPALKYTRKAAAHVQLKPGIIGVRVKIMPPDAIFPDKIKIVVAPPPEEKIEEAPQEQKTEELPEQKPAEEETEEPVAEEKAKAETSEDAEAKE
jgi:small subunit ribosomal protein S3